MAYDGLGTFTPAAAPNFPAVSGAVIASAYYNAVINDLAAGLSLVLTRDGQGKPSANIDWNNKNLTGVATFGATTATIGTLTLTAALGVAQGGLGITTIAANGQIPIGNGTGYTAAVITAGSGITVTNGVGSITIAATAAMVYPGAGIAVSTGVAWGASKTTPAGVIVGDTDAQTLSNKTLTAPVINGGTVTPAAAPTANGPGYLGLPQNPQTASYTLIMADYGKELYISGTTAAQSITIPANGGVAFPIGAFVLITNDSNQSWTISITTDTLFWSPSSGTGTRTLAAGGQATIRKVTATRWWVSGSGLT